MIDEWYVTNIRMLERLFGRVSYDDQSFEWILVHRLKLPPFYNKKYTALLITTPGFNITNHNDYDFYIDKKLQRNDIAASEFIFDGSGYNPLSHKNFARLCFNLKSFCPASDVLNGDNIIDLCQSVYNFLAQRKGG